MEFKDWRYVIVDRVDRLIHWLIPCAPDFFLCELERRMYHRRMVRMFPDDYR